MTRLHIDFETRSLHPIKYGAYRYAEDASTDVLCIAYAFDDNEPELWFPPLPQPKELIEAARDPQVEFHAFNVGFERRIWNLILHKRMGWPELPLSRWYDTQADAFTCGFPGQLEMCALALKVINTKDPKGKRLISKLCVPIAHTNKFREKEDYPEDYHELYQYCLQDVRTERDVYHALPYHTTASGQERRIFQQTEGMNDAGVPIDTTFVESLLLIMEEKIDDANERAAVLTAGEVYAGTQYEEIRKRLHLKLPNMQKQTVAAALKGTLDSHDRTLLECRQACSHTSTAKYDFIKQATCSDGTVKDNLQYHGAAATGRLAGRGLQIQNLPRMTAKAPDGIVAAVCHPHLSYESIEFVYGDIMETGVSMVRPSIKAPEGKRFTCSDYSQIESRARAWSVGDTGQLEAFALGRDCYKATAADMYNVSYETVDDNKRQAGKVADLACGFQGGWKALKDFALLYGIRLTNQNADRIVKQFRAARPLLVEAWSNFGDAALEAANMGRTVRVLGVEAAEFGWSSPHLWLRLPSGRRIWFPYAEVKTTTKKYVTADGEHREFEATNVHHMKVDTTTKQWVERGLHGGSFYQSYIQGLCRDLLMHGQLNLKKEGWNLIMSVHDECLSMDDDSPEWSLARFDYLLCDLPAWAEGFPIKSAGWQGYRYRK